MFLYKILLSKFILSVTATYPGYTPPDASTLPSQHWQTSHTDLSSSSLLQNDVRTKNYTHDFFVDILANKCLLLVYFYLKILGASVGARPQPASNGYPSTYEDPYLVGRRDIINESGPGISSILNDRPESLRKADVGRESHVLFVDALPSDCSRREVSRILFRLLLLLCSFYNYI